MFRWTKLFVRIHEGLKRFTLERRRRRQANARPGLESLEDRFVPAVWTVDVTTDAAPNGGGQGTGQNGDLRYCAASAANGDTIQFAAGIRNDTITVASVIVL